MREVDDGGGGVEEGKGGKWKPQGEGEGEGEMT